MKTTLGNSSFTIDTVFERTVLQVLCSNWKNLSIVHRIFQNAYHWVLRGKGEKHMEWRIHTPNNGTSIFGSAIYKWEIWTGSISFLKSSPKQIEKKQNLTTGTHSWVLVRNQQANIGMLSLNPIVARQRKPIKVVQSHWSTMKNSL